MIPPMKMGANSLVGILAISESIVEISMLLEDASESSGTMWCCVCRCSARGGAETTRLLLPPTKAATRGAQRRNVTRSSTDKSILDDMVVMVV